jgi:hypothetical protein
LFWHTAGVMLYRDFEHCGRAWEMKRAALAWVCAVVLVAGWSGLVFAQEAQDAKTPTLHVYTNLIQIPVLILDSHRQPMGMIAADKFSLSLDDGPPFQATHVRLEGDDPISLAILLDLRGDATELMGEIDDAIAELAPVSLRPRDHLSIYALDCNLIRGSIGVPAQSAGLKQAVDRVLQPWVERGGNRRKSSCKKPIGLWDALAYVSVSQSRLPGRRVVLAVTDGVDSGRSKRSWNSLRSLAEELGVAIFGMTYLPNVPAHHEFLSLSHENAFILVCELTGGMVMPTPSDDVARRLKHFTELVRGRYIVEFRRPSNATAGPHLLVVRDGTKQDFVRPTGLAVPLADPSVAADPTTIPSDPTLAPTQGSRRVLTPQ